MSSKKGNFLSRWWASCPTYCTQIPELPISKILFADTRIAILWLVVRLYVGYEWLMAGWGKFNTAVWMDGSGTALGGFVKGALTKASGAHPDVQGWYAYFLNHFVLPNAGWFSYIIVGGEILIGLALILGAFTGVAAFFGAFMNMNFLLAGAVSVNPILIFLELFLILGWRVAGWYGLDRYILKYMTSHCTPLHLLCLGRCKK